MPGEAADKGSDIALDALTGRATQTARTTYLALLITTAPTDATTMATMVEITTPATNGYARQSVPWSVPAASSGTRRTENSSAITFGPFTADLPNVLYCALVSAATGTAGDFLAFWTLDTPRDPANGDSIQFAAGALYLTLD